MLDDLPALAAIVTAGILEEVPGLEAPEVAGLVDTMSQANGAMVLDGMVRDVSVDEIEVTADFVRGTQALAHYRIPLASLLRAYRVGHAHWSHIWTEQVGRRVAVEDATAVVAAGSRYLFAWVDRLSDRATTEYLDEETRLARQVSVTQVALVRGVLKVDPDDLAAESRRLGYDLGASHLAVVLKVPPGKEMTDALLERAARSLADASGTDRRLGVPVDDQTAWIWLGAGTETDISPTMSGGLRAGLGRPGRGLAGFRASHREALEASRIAELGERPWGSVTQYADVDLAALCTADIEACRRFVRTHLGPLAVADDESRRLIATLRVFFAEGSNYRATARRLGLHHNTVIYRITQAEKLLGHPLAEGRIQLEVALDLTQLLGQVVHDD